MPRVCSICSHPDKDSINAALVENVPYRNIAERFGTSVAALTRHKAEHLPATLAKAQAVKETAQADDLLGQLKALRTKAVGILLKAEQAGDLRTALLAIREARSCLETLLEVEGELNRRPQVNLNISTEWLEVRAVVLQALQPYPDARLSVANALRMLDIAG